MRRLLSLKFKAAFVLGLFLSQGSPAYFLIEHDLVMRQKGSNKREVYTVLVILADHFRESWPGDTSFQGLLADNHCQEQDGFLLGYRKVPMNWYLDLLKADADFYGPGIIKLAERPEELFDPMSTLSSMVVITKHGDINSPLAMIRMSTAGKEGLLTLNRYFLNRGLNGRKFPSDRPTWRKGRMPRLVSGSIEGTYPLYPLFSSLEVLAPEYGDIEIENRGVAPEYRKKFFPFLMDIAYVHGLFHWPGEIPEKIASQLRFHPQAPQLSVSRAGKASRLYVGVVGDDMRSHHATMGFRTWDRLQNEFTYGLDLAIMYGRVDELVKGTVQIIDAHYPWALEEGAAYLVNRSRHERRKCGPDLYLESHGRPA